MNALSMSKGSTLAVGTKTLHGVDKVPSHKMSTVCMVITL